MNIRPGHYYETKRGQLAWIAWVGCQPFNLHERFEAVGFVDDAVFWWDMDGHWIGGNTLDYDLVREERAETRAP